MSMVYKCDKCGKDLDVDTIKGEGTNRVILAPKVAGYVKSQRKGYKYPVSLNFDLCDTCFKAAKKDLFANV